MIYKIGDDVIVVDSGGTYNRYDSFPGIKRFVPGFAFAALPNTGGRYTVTHVGVHDTSNRDLYVLDGMFIMDENALALVHLGDSQKRRGSPASAWKNQSITMPDPYTKEHFHKATNG